MAHVASIVEGHGEVDALPALLRRIWQAEAPGQPLGVNPPIRIKSGSYLNDEVYFRRYTLLAAAKAAQSGGFVVILLDCEDNCPAQLGPKLLARAQAVRNDVSYLVVLAYREFESWFLAAARSLRGHYGLPADLEPPQAAEDIRNAKGWLGERMELSYDPVIHQTEFCRFFDLQQARNNPSFSRFYSRVAELLQPQG